MKAYKLELTATEKEQLRKSKIRIDQIADYATDELCMLMHISDQRAKEIHAIIAFQKYQSIGPKFAKDLVQMGYYSIDQLKEKNGAELLDEYERFINAWTDPCVEDQFRLVVYYANHPNDKKQWWDFTEDRKAFRAQYGYPATRPKRPWPELEKYQKKP